MRQKGGKKGEERWKGGRGEKGGGKYMAWTDYVLSTQNHKGIIGINKWE